MNTSLNETYIAVIDEYWDTVARAYLDFEEKKPVILIDVQAAKVYAYPYDGFKATLSRRSQKLLRQDYEDAIETGKFVVFVRDNEKRKLVSCRFPVPQGRAHKERGRKTRA